MSEEASLPLTGVRVVEFAHTVTVPTCAMVLADLGAEVIKVEPILGDNTRKLLGAGAGFFALVNRNKKSIALDLQTVLGREAAIRLIGTADIVSENFKPGTMKKLGLDYASRCQLKPRLASNNDRVRARSGLLPLQRAQLAHRSVAELSSVLEKNALPFAPITRPQDLFDDPHLKSTGGLARLIVPDGRATPVPLLPLALGGERLKLRHNPPRLGQHSQELLASLDYDEAEIAAMRASGVTAIE